VFERADSDEQAGQASDLQPTEVLPMNLWSKAEFGLKPW
jgi:hypothetical protein